MTRRIAAALVSAAFLPATSANASTELPAATQPNALAIRAALRGVPFFTEVFVPRRPLQGIVITLHRGAWGVTGQSPAATEHADDHAWVRRRWLVVNSSYRPGTQGLTDVRTIYRRVRRATHAAVPICLVGASSGGNLALVAATQLPGIACVVAESAPSDLVDIASQTAYDPSAPNGASSTGPSYIHDVATQRLGESNLGEFSPLFATDRITASVLLAQAQQDPLIPEQQQSDLCSRLGTRCVGSLALQPGPLSFVHAGVARSALMWFRRRETALARDAVRMFRRRR